MSKIARWVIIMLGTASIALPVAIIGWTYHPLIGIFAGLASVAGVILPAVWRPKVYKD